MGAALQIDAHYDDASVRAALGRLAQFPGGRLDAASDEAGEYLVSTTVKRFHAQQSPLGTPWKPSHRAKKVGGETLIDTGMLIRSLTHNVLAGKGVEWGSPVKYAAVHQEGATFTVYPRSQKVYRRATKGKTYSELSPRFVKKSQANFFSWATIANPYLVKIPARPFLGLDEADAQAVPALFARHLGAALLGLKPGAAS